VPRHILTRLKYLLSQVNNPVLLLLYSTFEYYPLVSRGYLAFALHLTNFVGLIPFLVVITLRVLGYRQPGTPFSESNLHCNAILLVNVTGKFLNSIWLFLDYRIHPFVLLPLTVLPRPSSVHKFFRA
jgi:hypothetical protein